MNARDLMTAEPRTVTPDDRLTHAAAIMRDFGVGMVPVVDDPSTMHVLGVITDRDVAVRCVAARHDDVCRVSEHMTRGPLVRVSPEADVHEVMRVMQEHQVRRVLVTAGDRLVGVIALADLARREGPAEPLSVEAVLERISEADHTPAGV